MYDGLIVYGFKYYDGIFNPETGEGIIDNFDNDIAVRKDNLAKDSTFRSFLAKSDTSKMTNWLLRKKE